MATNQQSRSSTRQVGCPQVIFSDEDGIFWLRAGNLTMARKLLDLPTDQVAVGYDVDTVKVQIDTLIDQGVSVGIASGSKVWTITKKAPFKPGRVASKTVWLSPLFLFDRKELACIGRRLASTHQSVENLIRTYAGEDAIRELGVLYVYQAAQDLFEIDYQLTTIPKVAVEALAFVAYQSGLPLRCEVVPPKSKRSNGHRQASKISSVPQSSFMVSEPTAYGQLRFDI